MERAVQVRISRRQVGQREFDGITVVISDLHLNCDLRSDRDIRLAHRLAENHQAAFIYDPVNAERVRKALAERGVDVVALEAQQGAPVLMRTYVLASAKGIEYIGRHKTEDDCWFVALGWPSADEIAAKAAAGWYCTEADVTWHTPATQKQPCEA